MKQSQPASFSPEIIEQKIFLIRGHKVMIDRDLAFLYAVETKYLNRQVRRNSERFPPEFMFRLTRKETKELVTICHRFKTLKHSSSRPYVFTENGVAMLASVLNSPRAIKMSIHIIKTFVRLRNWAASHKGIMRKLTELEQLVRNHDKKIHILFEAIRGLMPSPIEKPRRRIGFHP